MSIPDLPTLVRCRSRARLLLSHLRGNDAARARASAQRLAQLRSFAALGVDGLLADIGRVRLKHALTVVAVELGHASWVALKATLLAAAPAAVAADRTGALPADALYVERMTLYLNRWFASHDEARRDLDAAGGYLLPYRHQFFVTCAGAIRELGLDPDDNDWQRIGFDWAQPRDVDAHARLVDRRRAAMWP